ncbi:MAG: histidinol-phosphatase HisJ [Mariprofundaceae bacterium]|nr:histidinol-phosphatase HisJ [Mariprofundaceae bacterium]
MLLTTVPDYHMHTPRCNHAIGDVIEYAQVAVQLGIKEIGFSDHCPMPNGFDAQWRMSYEQLDAYLSEIEAARAHFAADLKIRVGLELDYVPHHEAWLQKLSDYYDWDYLIGSVHFIGDWAFDNEDHLDDWQHKNINEAYVSYYDVVAESAKSGFFDVIGHPDLIKKFGHRATANDPAVHAAEERMLQAVKQANIALEISSAGLRKPVAEVYPHARILARAAELGIPFCFGSDAHAPGEVGYAMQDCVQMLDACGVSAIHSFEKRQRCLLSLR